jgi:hypothetical protein
MTSLQQEPSANKPCASTAFRALIGAAFGAAREPAINVAAAAPARPAENVRRFIIVLLVNPNNTIVAKRRLEHDPPRGRS